MQRSIRYYVTVLARWGALLAGVELATGLWLGWYTIPFDENFWPLALSFLVLTVGATLVLDVLPRRKQKKYFEFRTKPYPKALPLYLADWAVPVGYICTLAIVLMLPRAGMFVLAFGASLAGGITAFMFGLVAARSKQARKLEQQDKRE